MNVDAQTYDIKCAASLLTLSENGGLGSEGYPHMGDKEPPELVIDAAAAAAMNVCGSDKEIKDPQDYVPDLKQHNLLAMPLCYISTDASADCEKAALDVVKEAKIQIFDLERDTESRNNNASAHAQKLRDAQARLASAEAKLVPQSTPLRADNVVAEFNPDDATWKIEATYTNPTQKPISATASLARTVGLNLLHTEFVQRYYRGKPTFKPNREAKEVFDEACASKTSGASLESIDRTAYTQTSNVPAFTPWMGASRRRAEFTAVWVLSCDDVEGKAHLLPHVQGKPRCVAYDFAVKPPPQLDSGPTPFMLRIKGSQRTMRLDLPSREAAKLDAERRGEPTWWVHPSTQADGDDCELAFGTPPRHSPCIRFRFSNECYDDDDFPVEALGSMSLKSEGVTAKVLSWAATGTEECVARVRISVPRVLPKESKLSAPAQEREIVIVCDLSGSMGCRDGGPHTRRELVLQEVALLLEKLLKYPEAFKKAGIVGPDDTFTLSIVGFHSSASYTCHRVPLERESVDAALADFRARSDSGGTVYASWASLLRRTERGDHVVLCLLTDGALWDERDFKEEYGRLKNAVGELSACAIGCGSWANHDSVKLVATIENGEALITKVDPAVSSKASQLVGKCLAAGATKLPITIDGKILSHTGIQPLPGFVEGWGGFTTVYTAGLGATIDCVVSATYSGSDVRVSDVLVGRSCDNPQRISVATRGALHDPREVLRHLDPLFVSKTTTLFKDDGLRTAALLGIGMHCKMATSEVKQLTTYEFDPNDDNSIKLHTRAVVPTFDAARMSKGIEWLRMPPSASDTPLVVTEYKRKPLQYAMPEDCGYGPWRADGDQPAYRSLGASDESDSQPEYRSLGADVAPAPPAFRSLSASSAPAPAPAPPPPKEQPKKAEVDEAVDVNATPSFAAASKLMLDQRLLGYLNEPSLAHIALQDVVDAFGNMSEQLWHLKKSADINKDPMADIVDITIAAVSGPSFDDILSNMWPVLGVLMTFVMRFNVNVDLNLHNEPILSDDVDTAILRVAYLLAIASRLHEMTLEYKRPLWRAVLTTKAVEDDSSNGSKITARITWESEHVVRHDAVSRSSDKVGVIDVMKRTACVLNYNFTAGGYEGGRWASEGGLVLGPKPPDFPDFDVALPNKFVRGQHYNPQDNVIAPLYNAISALPL